MLARGDAKKCRAAVWAAASGPPPAHYFAVALAVFDAAETFPAAS